MREVDAVDEQPGDERRRPRRDEHVAQPGVAVLDQQDVEQVRGHRRAGDGEPEDAEEQHAHRDEAPHAVGEDAVERAVEGEARAGVVAVDAGGRESGGVGVEGLDDAVADVVGQRAAQPGRLVEEIAAHPARSSGGRQLAERPVAHRGLDARVALEQAQGHPAGVRHAGELARDTAGEVGHRLLQRRVLVHEAQGRRRVPGARDLRDRREQLRDALVAARGHRDDGDAELAGQVAGVDREPVATRLVDEVERDHDPSGDLADLQHQRQVALQARRVHDHDDDVRLPEEQRVAGDVLVGAGGQQRVGAGQVDDPVAGTAVGEAALGARHRLARPVADVLAQTGQRVEDGALAGVRVARQGDDVVVAPRREPEPGEPGPSGGQCAGGTARGGVVGVVRVLRRARPRRREVLGAPSRAAHGQRSSSSTCTVRA